MEDFIKWAPAIGVALSPVMRLLVMKRDSELPWVWRIGRWVGLTFFVCWCALTLAEKAKEIGLW